MTTSHHLQQSWCSHCFCPKVPKGKCNPVSLIFTFGPKGQSRAAFPTHPCWCNQCSSVLWPRRSRKQGGGNTRSVLCHRRAVTDVAFRQAEAAHEEASCPQVLMLQLSRAGCGYRSPLRLAVASSSSCRRPFPSRGAFAAILPAKLKNKKIKIPVQCLKSQPNGWHWHQALLAFLFGVSRQHVCL